MVSVRAVASQVGALRLAHTVVHAEQLAVLEAVLVAKDG